MAFDTATILDSLKTCIEAVTPAVQVSADDVFRCTIGSQVAMTGPRAVLLSAEGGTRKPQGGLHCNQWETTVSILTVYMDTPAEPGHRGAYSHALQDAEDMLQAIYVWSVTTNGILSIDPQPAQVDADDGVLLSERSIFIEFQRS